MSHVAKLIFTPIDPGVEIPKTADGKINAVGVIEINGKYYQVQAITALPSGGEESILNFTASQWSSIQDRVTEFATDVAKNCLGKPINVNFDLKKITYYPAPNKSKEISLPALDRKMATIACLLQTIHDDTERAQREQVRAREAVAKRKMAAEVEKKELEVDSKTLAREKEAKAASDEPVKTREQPRESTMVNTVRTLTGIYTAEIQTASRSYGYCSPSSEPKILRENEQNSFTACILARKGLQESGAKDIPDRVFQELPNHAGKFTPQNPNIVAADRLPIPILNPATIARDFVLPIFARLKIKVNPLSLSPDHPEIYLKTSHGYVLLKYDEDNDTITLFDPRGAVLKNNTHIPFTVTFKANSPEQYAVADYLAAQFTPNANGTFDSVQLLFPK